MHAPITKPLAFVLGAISVLSIALSLPARAEITGVTVRSAKDMGPFRGKPYREIEAQMQGTAPGGAYNVPVTLAFPTQASDHNGFAIVDVVNTVRVVDPKAPPPKVPRPLARAYMGEDFLFGRGNAYVSVLWDKHAVDVLGNGTLVRVSDGWTILHDAATLARNLSKYLPPDSGATAASGKVIAFGYSQTGELLRGLYYNHLNSRTGNPAFDGALVGGAAGGCRDPEKMEFMECTGGLADGGKVIALATETDAQWGADAERGDNPSYRSIEVAGVSHIPASIS